MDAAIPQGLRESVVDQSVLVDAGETVEPWCRQSHLKVVPTPGPIVDLELGRIRKRLCKKVLQRRGTHLNSMVAAGLA